MMKISGKVDKQDTTGLVVISRSLFTEELLQIKHFSKFFYILAIEEIDKIKEELKI